MSITIPDDIFQSTGMSEAELKLEADIVPRTWFPERPESDNIF
ncbi:hypothetical protein [Lyngbya sp. CCY1209]|jgi:hypothetical protein|nr:hypothetical protein [Lyngbya sp. CCY1209]